MRCRLARDLRFILPFGKSASGRKGFAEAGGSMDPTFRVDVFLLASYPAVGPIPFSIALQNS
jgi:hypothetical protein